MVFFTPSVGKQSELQQHMKHAGILIGGQSPTIRMVLHRDVTDEGLAEAIYVFQTILN